MSAAATRLAYPQARRDGVVATGIAAILLVIAALTAAAIAASDPATIRGQLGFGFGGIDPLLSEVAAIMANNLRALVAVLIACGAVQLARRTSDDSVACRATVGLCDLTLVAVASVHAVLVGLGVGAYGGRMVSALLPHGPIELAAYSLALALYLAARREWLSVGRWIVLGGGSALGIAVAAPLEVFVTS